MTIKVERDALLRVLSRAPFEPHCEGPIRAEDEFVLVNVPSSCYPDDCLVEKLRSPYDDDSSLCTLSTASSTIDSDAYHEPRKVTFAEPLVTDTWTRPWTRKEDIPSLFYSTEETSRFRQEYRLERKLLTELSVDPDTFPVHNGDLSNLFDSTHCSLKGSKHRISRVVVLHDDKLETFMNPHEKISHPKDDVPLSDDFFDNESFWSGSITWY